MLKARKPISYISICLCAVSGILIIAVCFSFITATVKFDRIPNVEKDFFNSFINQKGQNFGLRNFGLDIAFAGYGGRSVWIGELTYKTVPIITGAIALVSITFVGQVQKGKISQRFFHAHSVLIIILFINFLVQIILFMSSDMFETAFRSQLFNVVEKNFITKTLGEDKLNQQISIATEGLKQHFGDNPYQALLVSVLVISGLATVFLIAWNVLEILLIKKHPELKEIKDDNSGFKQFNATKQPSFKNQDNPETDNQNDDEEIRI